MSYKKNNVGTAMHTTSPRQWEPSPRPVEEVERLLSECQVFSSLEERRALVESHDFGGHVEYFDAGKAYCIHCNKIINPQEFKFFGHLIMCPNYPICDGTMKDWMPTSWYHPPEEQ